MKILLLDSAERVIVESLAIVFRLAGHDTKPAHRSTEAIELTVSFAPDWFYIILNNVIDADPAEVIVEVARLQPACKFFITAGRSMPEVEDKLWEAGYQLRGILPFPIHPADMVKVFDKGESMLVRRDPGAEPKFIMAR